MEPFTLALGLSLHSGLTGEYNQIHPHIRFYKDGVIAGAYHNSMERLSVYGGYRIEPTENLGVEFTLVTGYNEFGPIAPFVRGTYDLNNTRLFVSPVAEKWNGKVETGIVIGVEIKIK